MDLYIRIWSGSECLSGPKGPWLLAQFNLKKKILIKSLKIEWIQKHAPNWIKNKNSTMLSEYNWCTLNSITLIFCLCWVQRRGLCSLTLTVGMMWHWEQNLLTKSAPSSLSAPAFWFSSVCSAQVPLDLLLLCSQVEAAGSAAPCLSVWPLKAPQWWSLTSARIQPMRRWDACRVTSKVRVTWRLQWTCRQRRAWRICWRESRCENQMELCSMEHN